MAKKKELYFCMQKQTVKRLLEQESTSKIIFKKQWRNVLLRQIYFLRFHA